jgi:hypothetical protein
MPPSPGSSSPERTGARPSPVLLVCSSLSRSPSPAWEPMAPCSGRVGLPICICGQVALLGEREPPTACEGAGTEVRTAKEGGRRCHRSGRRRMRRQARWARRRSRRRRPHAGSSRGWVDRAPSPVGVHRVCSGCNPAAGRGQRRAEVLPGDGAGSAELPDPGYGGPVEQHFDRRLPVAFDKQAVGLIEPWRPLPAVTVGSDERD